MAVYTSIRDGLTSDTNPATNPWGNATLPASGDKVTIAAGHTVTLDSTCHWGDDTTTAITVNGTLKASRTTSGQLTCRGDLDISSTGTLDFGRVPGVGDGPIPAGVTHTVILNDSASPALGKYGLTTVNGSACYTHGVAKAVNAFLTTQADIGATSILVDDATGWAANDAIILGPTGLWSDTDELQVSGTPTDNGNGTWTVGLSAALTKMHMVGGPVGNFTHNVVFKSPSTTLRGYFTQEWGATQPEGSRDLRYTLFLDLGATGGGNERKWGSLAIYGGTQSVQQAGSPLYVKGISVYTSQINAHGISIFNTKHRITIEDVAIAISSGAGMSGIHEANGAIADLNRHVTYRCNSCVTSGYGQGGVNVRHTDCHFLGASGYNSSLLVAMAPAFERCVFDASAGAFFFTSTLNARFIDCDIGTKFSGTGLTALAGIWQTSTEGGIASVTHTDCRFQAGIDLVNMTWAGAKVQDTSAGTEFRFSNLGGDPLKQIIYTPGGMVERDQVTVPAGYDSSIKSTPFGGTATPLTSAMQVMAPNGTPVVVTGWAYITTAYNGTAPTASLSGLGVDQSVALDLGVRDAWQQFVVVATQSSGADGVLALTLSCDGTAGEMYWSGLSNPPSAAITTGGFRWWDGGAPVGALLANFVAASDVWGVQANQAQAAGSIGELTGEIWRRLGLDPANPLTTPKVLPGNITAGPNITIHTIEDDQKYTATRQ